MAQVPSLPDDLLELGRRLIPRPVFVVGCARSGTSIFGEALAAHPQVSYLFEVSSLWREWVPDGADHRLTAMDLDPQRAEAIYHGLREAAGDDGTEAETVLLEKNPKHVLRLPFLAALFPWAQFLHIVRDGRDVTASLMFRNRGESWGHLEVPGWRELLAEFPDKNWLRCAWQWRRAVETALADSRAPALADRTQLVRYEDLLAEPLRVLSESFATCGLELTSEVEDFASRIQDETRGSYHARRQVRHYVENHSRRKGRYLENLSSEQVADVETVCGDLLRELGYPVHGKD